MNTFNDMASLFQQLGTFAQRANEDFEIMNNRISQLENDYRNERTKNKQLLDGIKELIKNYDD